MAVVTIIGIFVAMATPTMGGILADRHAARAVDDITGLFRLARSRATATGAAHMVRVAPSGTAGVFELRAAASTVGPPTSSCRAAVWDNTDSVVLKTIDLVGATGEYGGRDIHAEAGTVGSTPTQRDYCYTPGGVPWWREGGAWKRPNGYDVSSYCVFRGASCANPSGIRRVIQLSASGVPSVEAD